MMMHIEARETWNRDDDSAVSDNDPADGFISVQMTFAAIVPAFLLFFHFFAVYPGLLLTASIASLAVTAGWLSYKTFKGIRPGVPSESESIMNFSQLGTLTCICDHCVPKDDSVYSERRQSCRNCGHTILAQNPARLDAVMTQREINALTAKLKNAAVEARGMELPSSIENIDQLVDYLHDAPPPPPNDPPRLVRRRQFA